MNLLFQLTVFSFIAFTILLVIGVPVVFAGNYGNSKNTLSTGIGIWFLLVFAVGIFNSFVV
uniref:Photosystem II reaction center protein Z n=1 Tax=Halimeda discoidea TaxID=118222 RepID=A0A1C9JB90_9CHLO|nr:photosystem II protein [Halimeda discoidea]